MSKIGFSGSNSPVVTSGMSYDATQFLGILDGTSNSYLVPHGLGTKYVDVSIYDDNGDSIVANNVNVVNVNDIVIEFVEVQSGKVLVQRGKS